MCMIGNTAKNNCIKISTNFNFFMADGDWQQATRVNKMPRARQSTEVEP